MTTYSGGCHCGHIKYKVEGEFTSAMECNCSHCTKKGFLLAFVPAEQFHFEGDEDALLASGALSDYRFNRKKVAHRFCANCGVQAYGRGERKDGTPTAMINLRCLEGFEATAEGPKLGDTVLSVTYVNGKDF